MDVEQCIFITESGEVVLRRVNNVMFKCHMRNFYNFIYDFSMTRVIRLNYSR